MKTKISKDNIDPHLHMSAVVRGARYFALAREHGDLAAGLKALGLGHLNEKDAVQKAAVMMDISKTSHGETYKLIKLFRSKVFKGKRFRHWVKAALEKLQREAELSYVQTSVAEVGRIVEISQEDGISLDKIRFLTRVARDSTQDIEKFRKILKDTPEIAGFDITGPEVVSLSSSDLKALTKLLIEEREQSIFRIHAGEGYLGEGGDKNVNIVLSSLVELSAKTDLTSVEFVLGHVARVANIAEANKALKILKKRHVDIRINVNPLSNIIYASVDHIKDIDAFKLDVDVIYPGTDNVGSLKRNREIVELALKGQFDAAQKKASEVLRLRKRWSKTTEHGTSEN